MNVAMNNTVFNTGFFFSKKGPGSKRRRGGHITSVVEGIAIKNKHKLKTECTIISDSGRSL